MPVTDLSLVNRDANALKSVAAGVVAALQGGKNVLLYPSGQIAGQGFEKIFNKQSAWAIVNALPEDVQVVGVRISGLWGSMWSRAWIGKSPNVEVTALKAIFYVIANLLFFVPRRSVTVEFSDITNDAEAKAKIGKNEFNLFLESFYNANGEEPVRFLKHFFYAPALKKKLPGTIKGSVADIKATLAFAEEEIPEDVYEGIVKILVHDAHLKEEDIQLNANLSLDLHIDSLGLVNIIVAIEEEFQRTADVEIATVKTVADLCFIAMNRKLDDEELKPSTLNRWHIPITGIYVEPTETIPALFLKTFSRDGSETFAYDKMLGTSTRKSFLLKAYVVSKILEAEVSGQYVRHYAPRSAKLRPAGRRHLSGGENSRDAQLDGWTEGHGALHQSCEPQTGHYGQKLL